MNALSPRWICLLCMALCGLHAAQLTDFTSADIAFSIHKERSCVNEGVQEHDGRPARVFSWSTENRGWTEMGFRTAQRHSLSSFPGFRKLRLTLDVWVPEDCAVSRVSLRLKDGDGEVHQVAQPLPTGQTGWQALVYDVDASKSSTSCWGGEKPNKLLDPPVCLGGMAISFGGAGKAGVLGFGAVRMDVIDADVEVRVDTGDPLNLVTAGRAPQLLASNSTVQTKTGRFEYVLTGPFGEELRREKVTLELPPQGTATAAILPIPERYGVYHVRWHAERVDLSGRPQASYVHMRPAGPTAEADRTFIFGMCDHLERYPQSEQELIVLAAARCGVKLLRGSACWSRVQRQPDTWDFSVVDDQLELLDRYGIAFEPIYSGNTIWATAKDWEPAVEGQPGRGQRPDYDAWRTYIARFAARYRDRIPYVVVWNEPDLHSFANFPPEDYVKLLELAYHATKKNAPDILVKTAGFSNLDAPCPSRSAAPKYMEQVLARSKGLYDIFCVHFHSRAARYHQRLQDMKVVRKRFGDDTPWASNETGITSIGSISELDQAETLFQKFLTAWSHGAISYSWYNMREKGSDPQDGEHNYGIITQDFQPKPAYAAYNTLASTFRDATFVSAAGGNRYSLMLFQDRDGDWLLPHWSWNSDRHDLSVTGITGQASLVDIFGNETPLTADGGMVLLEGVSAPVVLRISGQTTAPVPLGDILLQDDEFVVYPEQTQPVTFSLQNPTAEPLHYRYRFVPQAGLEIAPASGEARVEPGQGRDVSVRVTAAKGFRGQHVDIEVGVDDRWQVRVRERLASATAIPRDVLTAEPQFALQHKHQQRQLVPFEASWQHLFWRGRKDLSAKAWLSSSDEAFRIKIEVRDDTHRQPFRGKRMFAGDSIQIGLHFPLQEAFWEIGVGRHDDGSSLVHIWSAPTGYGTDAVAEQIRLQAARDENAGTTTYVAELPLAAFGVKRTTGMRRCRFNFLVNDCDDGKTRESYMQQFPGIGGTKSSRHFAHMCY